MAIFSKEILIKILEKEKEITSQFNMFNEDKHEVLSEMIYIVENDLDMDGVYDLELESDLEMNVISVVEYLNGDTELEDILYEDISNYEDIINGTNKVPNTNINVCKKMCSDCPFSKTSMQGFLANYTVDDFVAYQRASTSFPCHKMMTDGDKSPEETHEAIENGEMKLCRGYVESIIKSCKKPDTEILAKAVEFVREDGMSDNSMAIWDFKKFHERETVNN